MNSHLVQLYIDTYENNKDKFLFLCSSVAIGILSDLYNKFLADGDAIELKDLPKEKLQEYFELGERFGTETNTK